MNHLDTPFLRNLTATYRHLLVSYPTVNPALLEEVAGFVAQVFLEIPRHLREDKETLTRMFGASDRARRFNDYLIDEYGYKEVEKFKDLQMKRSSL